MSLYGFIFVIHLVATFFMTGVIWIIQLVHYPSFRFVSSEGFLKFSEFHQSSITWVVGPMMVVELLTGLYLWLHQPTSLVWPLLCFLTLLIWLSTFFLSVPLHTQLIVSGYDLALIDKLVSTNWPRTLFWSLRSLILIQVVVQVVFAKKI